MNKITLDELNKKFPNIKNELVTFEFTDVNYKINYFCTKCKYYLKVEATLTPKTLLMSQEYVDTICNKCKDVKIIIRTTDSKLYKFHIINERG